jgi:uncharacterized protein (TIGR03067 family)
MCRIITVLAVLGIGSIAAGQENKADPTKFEGTYRITNCEKNGLTIGTRGMEDLTVVFRGDTITITDKDGTTFLRCTFTLDTTSVPQKIAMTSVAPKSGERSSGVIDINGDDLRLCYSIHNGPMPNNFQTMKGQQSFNLKRINK